MPGLIARIESSVQGLDLTQLAGGLGGQIGALGGEFASWAEKPPGDFGAALGGLGKLSAPQLSIGGSFGGTLSGLGAGLQGQLGPLSGNLVGQLDSLPTQLEKQLTAAIQPLLERIAALQSLLASDWSCGLVPALVPPPAPVASPAPAPAPGAPAPPPAAPAPAAPAGALSPAQVDNARAALDKLPADMGVESLLRWVHERVGTFRPGYFTVRSLPVIDDIRDPLDTLVRWDDASAPALVAELGQTLDTLAALVRAGSSGVFARAVPPAAVAALPMAPLAAAATTLSTAVEALADAVQGGAAGQLATRLAAVQTAQDALLTQNAALTAAAAPREQVAAGLRSVAGELDAGVCRLLILLQPRATLTDLLAPLGGLAVPALPADAFAPVTELIGQVRDTLTGLLDQLDVSSVTAPLTAVFDQVGGVLDTVDQTLAQLSATALQQLGQARSAVQSLDLAALREPVETSLAQATTQIESQLAGSVGAAAGSLTEALQAARSTIEGLDPEALAEPIQQAIAALGELVGDELVERLAQVLEQLAGLADRLDELSFAPVTDEVIGLIGELKELIASIDLTQLPDPGPALVGEAMKVLPPSIIPLTDPLIADLDVQLAGSPTALLEQVKTLPDQARDRLLAFSPRAALTPVLVEPFLDAVSALDAIAPSVWIEQGDAAFAQLRQTLARQMDIGALLRPAGAAHAALLGELAKLQPSQLLAPIEQAIEKAVQAVGKALPIDDLAQPLNQVLGRVRSFSATLKSALDVAEHGAQKFAGVGEARAEFADWVDDILAKVPETPGGALASALDGVIAAARGARPDDLRAAWAAARAPLATALAAAAPGAQLARLLAARGRVASGLAALTPAQRAPIETWLAAPPTQGAAAGLAALGDLAVALAAADAAIAAQCDALAARFPGAEGPLASLLPTGPERPLREWLRTAIERQFGEPVIALLQSVKMLAGLVLAAVGALRQLVEALDAKLEDLLAAPVALAALLGQVGAIQQRLATLDLGVYTREIDAIYNALLDELRALDPRTLEAPLVAARDRLLAQLSLAALLPPALRGELDATYRELVATLASLNPDALLLEPLDAEYVALVQPLVDALQVGPAVQKVIDWLNSLDVQLAAEIDRVDLAYQDLLAAAPGGGAGGASAGGGLSL